MENNNDDKRSNDKRIAKTKEDKEASKALKKMEKEKRKEKSVKKVDVDDTNNNDLKNSVKEVTAKVGKIKCNDVSGNDSVPSEVRTLQTADISNKMHVEKIVSNIKSCSDSISSKLPKPDISKKINSEKVDSGKKVWFKQFFKPENCDNYIVKISSNENIHTEFLNLGMQIYNEEIYDSTIECQLFLKATLALLRDFNFSKDENLPRTFGTKFDSQIAFINQMRSPAYTIQTAVRCIKSNLMRMNESDNEKCKKQITDMIERFQSERIDVAQKTIVTSMSRHIKAGDRILVYGYSALVFESILLAWTQIQSDKHNKLTVCVVESYPGLESTKMIDRLKEHNINFFKTNEASVPTVMKQIDMVLLNADAILPDSTVLTRCGAASMAHAALLQRRPVVVCAETCKFAVQTATAAGEEATRSPWLELARQDSLGTGLATVLEARYDLVPHQWVTMVACELGTLAPTAASFVCHLKQPIEV